MIWHYRQPTTDNRLLITDYWSPITDHRLLVAGYRHLSDNPHIGRDHLNDPV